MSKPRVAVIGGGISGLSCAFALKRLGSDVQLFESRNLGGYVGTQTDRGFVVEHGPNGFLDNESETRALISELALQDQVVWAGAIAKSDRYIFWNSKLHKVPMSPPALARSSLLTSFGKLRLLREIFGAAAPTSPDESVFDFARRRFGDEVARRMVAPMVIGVFAGDAETLSVEEAFPRMKRAEYKSSSLILAAVKKRVGSRLFSFRRGTGELINRLRAELSDCIWSNCEVTKISCLDSTRMVRRELPAWELSTALGTMYFDQVVITVDHDQARKFALQVSRPELGRALADIPCEPVVSLSLGFSSHIPFSGFGTLVARESSGPRILGFLHPTDIFENRSPIGKSLVTVMMGGILDPSIAELNQNQMIDVALGDLNKILGDLPKVEASWLWVHRPGIPQYEGQALKRVRSALEMYRAQDQREGLYWCGNWLGGVSMNDCIRKSREVARRLVREWGTG